LLFAVTHFATCSNTAGSMPQTSATISGVYRAKCRLSTWNTERGCSSVSSRSGLAGIGAPPLPSDCARSADLTSWWSALASCSAAPAGSSALACGSSSNSYAQVSVSYWPCSGSYPEKRPPRSSVSTKASPTSAAALV